MRYGIISDIHGNLEALQAVVQACRDQGVRAYLCAGDIVGYGADPQECLKVVRDLDAVTVAGNHDWAVSGKHPFDHFNEVAQAAVKWTQGQLSKADINFLNKLKLVHQQDDLFLVHGSLDHPDRFNYIFDMSQTADSFFLMNKPLCFIGHTHLQQVYTQKDNITDTSRSKRFQLKEAVKYIINVGSVGQPRDDNPKAAFCIYDPDLQRIELKRVSYDVKAAQEKILAAGLPEMLATRLSMGQ